MQKARTHRNLEVRADSDIECDIESVTSGGDTSDIEEGREIMKKATARHVTQRYQSGFATQRPTGRGRSRFDWWRAHHGLPAHGSKDT